MRPFVFLSVFLYSLSTISSREVSKGLRGFSIDLIHHDSPLSPFYNSSLTSSERIKNAALRSISRLNRVSYSLDENKSPESILIPDHGEYLMRFYIGTPPVERLAIVDTGSDLIWVQCSPCDDDCFPQDTPLFDPTKSSTYTKVQCDSQVCSLVPYHASCGSFCMYLYNYGDTSYSIGILGTEYISFGSTGGSQTITFPNNIFGCGISNGFKYRSNKVTGLVGLGAGPLSLVSQIGDQIDHKFSYCLLPLGSNSASKLKFGSEATIKGNGVVSVSTPLIINPSFPSYYLLHLEGVTVGQNTIRTDQTGGNIVIDSGTPLTYLKHTFYKELVALLQELLGVKAIFDDLPKPFDFCFSYQANMVFPDIVFQFTGANISLGPKNLLFRFDDKNMVCLAVVPIYQYSASVFSIFGNVAQIDFQVEYDLKGKQVSFAPTDCSKN